MILLQKEEWGWGRGAHSVQVHLQAAAILNPWHWLTSQPCLFCLPMDCNTNHPFGFMKDKYHYLHQAKTTEYRTVHVVFIKY
jgi:hypothetical protein